MKEIKINNKLFNLKNIKQLYPAVLVKTGYKDETTEMSLEWLDTESKGRVEVDSFGIFIIVEENVKHSFLYETRVLLETAITELQSQIQNR